jgi:predicted PurR-regulated permease PerM
MTKKIVLIGAAVLTTLLALIILWQFHEAVIYVLISLAVAATMRPLIQRLNGQKIILRLTWILVYIVVLGGIGTLLFYTFKTAGFEIQYLTKTMSSQDTWTLPSWLAESSLHSTLVAWLPPPSTIFKAITGDKGQLVLPAVLNLAQNIGGTVAAIIIILFLSIYWSGNQVHFERLWLSLLAPNERKQARGVWRVIEPEIGAYIRSELVHSLLTSLLLGVGFWLIGSPYPAVLALAGVIACLIPMIGAPLLVIVVLLVGLLTSVPLGLFTALYALIILIAVRIWVKPRLFASRWNNQILTILLLIIFFDALGLIGIIVAPMISISCQIVWSRLVTHHRQPGAAEQISDLEERQIRLLGKVKTMNEPPPPLVTSSMERLSELIVKAQPVLQAAEPSKPMAPSFREGQK